MSEPLKDTRKILHDMANDLTVLSGSIMKLKRLSSNLTGPEIDDFHKYLHESEDRNDQLIDKLREVQALINSMDN